MISRDKRTGPRIFGHRSGLSFIIVGWYTTWGTTILWALSIEHNPTSPTGLREHRVRGCSFTITIKGDIIGIYWVTSYRQHAPNLQNRQCEEPNILPIPQPARHNEDYDVCTANGAGERHWIGAINRRSQVCVQVCVKVASPAPQRDRGE